MPPPLQKMQPSDFPLPDLDATEGLARTIAPLLREGDMLALTGDLGVGKTAFARALIQAMGITGDVPSPTFTLVQTYEAKGLLISHFDLYRLKSSDELDELGWDDALIAGVVLAEWPERAGNRLPENRLVLHFTLGDDGVRNCKIEKKGSWAKRL